MDSIKIKAEINMKKLILISVIACLFVTANSNAQSVEPEFPWVKAAEADDSIIYVNVETIKDLGGGIKQTWEMVNFSSVQKYSDGKDYQSRKIRFKYDCLNETSAFFDAVYYSQKNGTGRVESSFSRNPYEAEWESVVPGTIGEEKWKFVCAK